MICAGAGPCCPGRHHAARHVHHPGQHPELPAPGGIHQGMGDIYNIYISTISTHLHPPGYRRLVRGVRVLRVRGAAGVRHGQLCLQVRAGVCVYNILSSVELLSPHTEYSPDLP